MLTEIENMVMAGGNNYSKEQINPAAGTGLPLDFTSKICIYKEENKTKMHQF